MRAVLLASLAASILATLPPAALQAQSGKVPKRPNLEAGADTNFAPAYYEFGMREIERDPQKAADAFYWATRLDPAWAQPVYARRVALLMADPRLLVGYMRGNRRFLESKEARRIDSLELRALTLDPFLNRDLDKQLIVFYLRALFQEMLQQNGQQLDAASSVGFEYYMEHYLRNDARERVRASMAMSEGRVPDALELYRKAIPQEPDDEAWIHVERARAFHMLGNEDSTRAELAQGLEKLRKRDQTAFVFVYESKALLEHLSYSPAHIRLGSVALAVGDTTSALSKMDLAVQVKPDDPWVRATYGQTLAQTGRAADAAVQLKKAVDLEPFYPGPYYLLGRVAETLGKPAEAAEDYRGYLTHASSRDVRVPDVKQRLAALGPVAGERP